MATVLREVYGLFVDDPWFTAAIVAWLGLVWPCAIYLARLHFPRWGAAALLFGGLALILLESTVRFAVARSRR